MDSVQQSRRDARAAPTPLNQEAPMTHLLRTATALLLVAAGAAHAQDSTLGRNLAATCSN